MTKWKLLLVMASTAVFVVSSVGIANADGGRPPGWDKGEKKGWEGGDMPPGLAKKEGWLPPGLSKEEEAEWKNGRPPGWSRGEKVGWRGADMPPGLAKKGGELPPGLAKNTPPGWEKWNDEEKRTWEKEFEETREKVLNKAKILKDFSQEDMDSAIVSVEASTKKGVPIKLTREIVEEAMDKGIRGRGLETTTRAVAYGIGKEIDFDQIGDFVHKKLEQGLKDDELSIEIYKEIASRHDERVKTREATHGMK